nr:hypothetical protein [Tanacetum cinerariifolium]
MCLTDGKKVVVFEDIIRRDLHLDDADGVECLPNEEIFIELAQMDYEKPPPNLTFYKAFFNAQWKYTSLTLTQKVFPNMQRVRKGFSGVETPLFASMLVLPQPQAAEEDEVKVPTAPAPTSPTSAPSPLLQYPTLIPHATPLQDQLSTPLASPPHEQPTKNSESSMRMHPNRGEDKAIDADKDITLVDVEKDEGVVTMDVEPQGRITQEDVNAASKGVCAAELTVFNDEEVTMTMAQTLIKMKAEKAKLLDEQIAQKLHDEEVLKAVAKDKQEKDDMKRAQVLQKQLITNKKIFIGMLLLSKYKKGILTISESIKVSKRNQSL